MPIKYLIKTQLIHSENDYTPYMRMFSIIPYFLGMDFELLKVVVIFGKIFGVRV